MARRRAETSESTKHWSVPDWVVTLGIGLSLVAVVVAGKYTRDAVCNWDRYTVAFADMDCTPPPAQTRQRFLAEVQYLAGIPDRLSVLDDDLAAHLADAFTRHPWVEKVEQLVVQPATRQMQAKLRFRSPTLAVQIVPNAQATQRAGSQSQPSSPLGISEESIWVVDGYGYVLPRIPTSEHLPLLVAEARPPREAGHLWDNEMIQAAARTAAYLRPHQNLLKVTRFRATKGELVLSTAAGTRVLWGHAPNGEPAGEAAAAQKLERLLDYCANQGDLDRPAGRYEHDVRPRAAAIHRALSADDPP